MSWECSSCGFANNDDSIESCMCGFTNPAHPTSATKAVEDDSVIVLRRKASKEWIGVALALWLMLIMYGLLGAVIPVVWNGDLNAVLPTDTRTFRNGMIFFWSIVLLAATPAMFRVFSTLGELYFHRDKLEIHTYLFHRKLVYNYCDITVNQHGPSRVTIHQRNLPSWKSPIKRLKFLYVDGATFSFSPNGYDNASKLPLIINILKSATDFREKALS